MGIGAPTTAKLVDEPLWPDEPGPYLFLIEESGPMERTILREWIARTRPEDIPPGHVQEATLPQTRRRTRRRRPDPRLEAFLATDDDPLLVPLRVVWLPSAETDGMRHVGVRDVLTFGDPRDPGPLSQYVIFRTRPDRCRIIMGEPARQSYVLSRWEQPQRRQLRGLGFAAYTAHQAWLTLERAERELRGNRYKVPRFVREGLVARHSFTRGVAELAREHGTSYRLMELRTKRYVREIAATHSPYVIDIVTGAIRWLIKRAYVDLRYSPQALADLYETSRQLPVVFLPSHKSNFDHLVLQYVLYQNGLPPNHTAGGLNMNFFPVGPIIRRSGVFFIRRKFKDNEPYKFVLRQYLDYLLEKRFPLEWYIEGGRSRNGKLREPRYGMLAYVVDSYHRGSTEDVVFVPVSIAYDQIQDVAAFAAEQTGTGKDRESLTWLVRAVRGLRIKYGAAHLRLGRPISLRHFLDSLSGLPPDLDGAETEVVPKLAFEIAVGINAATPITPISLVTLAMLSAPHRDLTLEEVGELIEPYLTYVDRKGLPVTEKLSLDDRDQLVAALNALDRHSVVEASGEPPTVTYRIGREGRYAAAYYRNTIVHHFLTNAIAMLATWASHDEAEPRVWIFENALRIRDLLKFEFFFAPSAEFIAEIRDELSFQDHDWESKLDEGDLLGLIDVFRPGAAEAVLRPFLEAYRVVANLIAEHPADEILSEEDLVRAALERGGRELDEGTIRSSESVSSLLFQNAVRLADNKGLLDTGTDRAGFEKEVERFCRAFQSLGSD